MKILTAIVVFLIVGCSHTPKPLLTKPDAYFKPRPTQTYSLTNGVNVILVEDARLPYTSVSVLIPAGSRWDVPSKSGVAAMTAELLDKGTVRKTRERIANDLGDMATEISASVGPDYVILKANTLSRFQSDILAIMAEVIKEPVFPEVEFKKTKDNFLSAAKRIVDSPSGFASQVMDRYLFEGHPYGLSTRGTQSSLSPITRADLVQFHRTHYVPQGVIIAVTGQVSDLTKTLLASHFGNWKGLPRPQLTSVSVKETDKVKILLVDKPDSVQSQIRIGQIGITRSHPDFLKLRVANAILGSGFTSRLMDRVRDELGLTYSIASQIDAMGESGSIDIVTFTQNDKTGQALKETLRLVKEFSHKGVTKSEVERAKNLLLGQFPQVVDTAESWAFNLMALQFHSVPETYLLEFDRLVTSITVEQVNEVIQKHFHPERMKVVVLGKGEAVAEQLKGIGDIEKRYFTEFQ